MNEVINKLEYPILTYDVIAKSLFLKHPNLIALIISDLTNIDYSLLENKIVLKPNELPIRKKNEKFKRCDFIIQIDKDLIINLELNRHYYAGLNIKNLSYIFNIYSTNALKGDKYNNKLSGIQININCFDKEDKCLSEYLLMEKDDYSIYTNQVKILTLNVENCRDVYYNKKGKVPNHIKMGTLFSSKYLEEIQEVLMERLSKKEVKSIMDTLNQIVNDDEIMSELEREKWAEWEENSIIQDAQNTGIQQGIKQGIEKNTVDMIKSMLKKKMSYSDISDISGKSLEEIKEIENSIKG